MGKRAVSGPSAPLFVKILKNVFKDLARKLHIKVLDQDVSTLNNVEQFGGIEKIKCYISRTNSCSIVHLPCWRI